MGKFLVSGGTPPPPSPHPPPPVGITLYKICQQVFIYNKEDPCTSHTSCSKVAILLLQDLSTLCAYMVYIFTCLFSVHNTITLSHHEHV